MKLTLTPENFAELIIEAIKGAVDGPRVGGRFAELESRLALLEQRVAELQAAPSLKFQGTYQDTKSYQAGDATTRQGALWACVSPTSGQFDHGAWQLCVKRGSAA